MKLDYGMIITIVAVLVFYLRLIILQRQRVKRFKAIQAEARKKQGNKKLKEIAQRPVDVQMGFRIFSWPMLVIGIIVILLGAFINLSPLFPSQVRTFWWIAVVVGIFLMNYSIR
jgi:hypothetical protein